MLRSCPLPAPSGQRPGLLTSTFLRQQSSGLPRLLGFNKLSRWSPSKLLALGPINLTTTPKASSPKKLSSIRLLYLWASDYHHLLSRSSLSGPAPQCGTEAYSPPVMEPWTGKVSSLYALVTEGFIYATGSNLALLDISSVAAIPHLSPRTPCYSTSIQRVEYWESLGPRETR